MSQQFRRFKGTCRPYADALARGAIDERIRPLVAAFNVPGVVSTLSSCEGHRWLFERAWQTAFVVFDCPVSLAFQLARAIRADVITGRDQLQYDWSVSGILDSDTEILSFILRCHEDRFRRARLDADFATLARWAEEIFAQAKNDLDRAPPYEFELVRRAAALKARHLNWDRNACYVEARRQLGMNSKEANTLDPAFKALPPPAHQSTAEASQTYASSESSDMPIQLP